MGQLQGKPETLFFDEERFNLLIQYSTQDHNQLIWKEHYCLNKNHDKKSIDIICINMVCSAQSRKLCSLCIRDETHVQDRYFSMNKLKSVKEISGIIQSFKDFIQIESKSFEFDLLITKLRFYDHKNKQELYWYLKSFEQYFENLQDFNKNVSKISIQTYLDCLTNLNTSLFEYFQQISSQLIELQNQYYNDFYLSQIQRSDNQIIFDIKQIEEFEKKKHKIILDLNQNPNYAKKIQNSKVRDFIEKEVGNVFQFVYQLYTSKNYDAVIEICQNILMQIKLSEKQAQDLLKIRTKTYFKIGKIEEAIQLSNQIHSSFVNIQYFFKLKAEQLAKQSKFDEAINLLDELIYHYPHYPHYPFIHIEKAKLLEICHKYEEALGVYDEIIKLKSYEQFQLQIYKMKAKLLEKCNKLDEAIIIYQKIIQLKPEDIQYQQELKLLIEKYCTTNQCQFNQNQ